MAIPPLDRALFAATRHLAYLNHAAAGVLARPAIDIAMRMLDEHGSGGGTHIVAWTEEVEQVRGTIAPLLGVDATELAFTKNTTDGLAMVANGIAWRAGERVLVCGREFPSTVHPWSVLRERGVEVDAVEPVGSTWSLPLERFEEHLRGRPARLVVVSWVQFARGFRIDLAALASICHAHGALLCVDAIQGLGAVPADFARWGVDFAAADAYKWMLGPYGTGMLFVADRHHELVRPSQPGWASVANRDDYGSLDLVFDRSARRYEGGSVNIEAALQLGASVGLLLDVGVEAIWQHIDGLLDHLVDRAHDGGIGVLSDRSAAGRSSIVTLDVGDDPTAVVARLRAADIVCSARGDGLRVSPHGYNTMDEIDALADAVVTMLR